MPTQSNIDNWEEEFDNQFGDWIGDWQEYDKVRVKAFIRSLLHTTRQQEIEEIEKMKETEELQEPELRQYENRGSAPFYCTLCGMSEMSLSDNKTEDGRYYCHCSYWSDPHNAYLDKSGGKWLGWKISEDEAIKLREKFYPNIRNETLDQVISSLKSNI